jgi:hypothetical protein
MEAIRKVDCPVCNRRVRVLATRAPSVADGHANIPDGQDICLDFGSLCEVGAAPPGETARCPVFGAPILAMGAARARAGLTPEPKVEIAIQCPACGREQPHELVGMKHVLCSVCGTLSVLDQEEK